MKSLRLIVAALFASTLLISCSGIHADSRHPTVSQQDAYDVSWGLPPRKVRGNPKMRYQYNARAEQAAATTSLDPEAAATPALAPAPRHAAQVTPMIPAALR
jgi:putative SOS response-associated peptidase YedK